MLTITNMIILEHPLSTYPLTRSILGDTSYYKLSQAAYETATYPLRLKAQMEVPVGQGVDSGDDGDLMEDREREH